MGRERKGTILKKTENYTLESDSKMKTANNENYAVLLSQNQMRKQR
jgi:hypothetical protein